MAASAELFIGLMSGTSLDGVDGILVDFSASKTPTGLDNLVVRAHTHRPFSQALHDELLALNSTGGVNELHRSCLAGIALARLYAEVVNCLLAEACIAPSSVAAIGAHGQTLRHQPRMEGDQVGYTVQINNPALLAELTGIAVVADFRSRDIAAGGQGAPLVPAFHRAMFARAGEAGAVLNLGGISNLTVWQPDGQVSGFDCGPANVLIDAWCQRHTGMAFDNEGRWAASGLVIPSLLQRFLQEPYFTLQPPKSTGRDLFNTSWLEARLQQHGDPAVRPEDVQATLCELTVTSCAQAIAAHAPRSRQLLVCGGGARNQYLMQRLAHHLPSMSVGPTDTRGLPLMQVEAAAFAWLAFAHVKGQPGNLCAVTGAQGPRVLGALYPV